MSNKNFISEITLNKLHLKLFIGITEEEQNIKQDVYIYVKLKQNKLPTACITDDIKGTICYSQIAEKINKFCEGKKFNLIEFLSFQLYNIIKDIVKDEYKVWLKVEKVKPPIENLLDGAHFTISEE